MENPKFLGSSFHHIEKGMEFQVSFDCVSEIDSETGVEWSKVNKINVLTLPDRKDGSELVDMEKLTRICEDKASYTIINHRSPENL